MFRPLFTVALIAAALRGLPTADATIVDCGAGGSLFTITKLSQDPPDTVSTGQNTTLTLFYTAPEEITAGTVTKSITLNFIPFSPTTEDLCTNAPCPITVGDHDGSSWFLFPEGVSGTLVSTVKWQDTAGRLLLCIKSTLRASAVVKPPAPVLVLERNESSSWWSRWF
jgi:hypothetical protein